MAPADAPATGPRHVAAGDNDDGQRIDNYLLRVLRGVPRMRVYRLLRRGEVRVNGGRVKPSYRVRAGDDIRLPPVRQEQHAEGRLPAAWLERLKASILYEDERALAIDKPAGLAVHAGSGIGGGVIDGLRTLRPDIEGLELVHRLDRGTSGCLLLARGRANLRLLQEELRRGGFTKIYEAILVGDWPGPEADVEVPLQRDVESAGERMVRVHPEGKTALSHFRRLRGNGRTTHVEVCIETGRTHQIRVHAAHLGYPVLGDDKYGDTRAGRAALGHKPRRMYLHASCLRFTGANGSVEVRAPTPARFLQPLETGTD